MSTNSGSEGERRKRSTGEPLNGVARGEVRDAGGRGEQGFDISVSSLPDCSEFVLSLARAAGVPEVLCKEVFQGFAGRASVGMNEAAKILKMHVKTLRLHVTDGTISYFQKGTGTERPRRIFTPNDLLQFYAGQHRRVIARENALARRHPNL
ncbi:helix-turn-helix domain-containing protein [Bradyrhizobium sp. BR 10289]|uniref:helix-turn-helix domain-containing protein n=1 Tax=Bradyrhizobium sp. BR 10289 TaxID=2749993 RepID=UPI001C646DDF|nr:helix-turn-helix domain-containing protein [Bradyrhizobium sp. BR 10289]MBW7973549.1 hypothetical protein [Bradyrhizobium sp. BR 10289]